MKYIATLVFCADSDLKAKFLLEAMAETFCNETPDVGLAIAKVDKHDEPRVGRVLERVATLRAEDLENVKPYVVSET